MMSGQPERSEVEELAVVFHNFLTPEPTAHVDRFIDARAAAVEVEAHRLPLRP